MPQENGSRTGEGFAGSGRHGRNSLSRFARVRLAPIGGGEQAINGERKADVFKSGWGPTRRSPWQSLAILLHRERGRGDDTSVASAVLIGQSERVAYFT
jgi:hypothetical protein